ncbi:protein kinase family protein [Modestobacter sp. VKM Ac-2979]|uniref:protein kinase family protein n=1 Tax=unclassified Modestobacter TaxID=2643866 RepID=UPI0022AB7C59|nr:MULTISPECIES: protein kinase family protein [unclassified Modestobacter]MCZ2810917.1 protein kinase family protein [Modestobacter sp. VKM Ac-2979]MCZ2840430.1 protein kinase family protein [Modestobacter sp. VKM Ac-2980]
MTSTTTGLPDRYRPLDQVAPDEETPTGVIRTWRARDRVLNRDVALRVHTPGGPAAREWINRALTAGGLATPALAMVYDAAEGTGRTEPGGAAYVVNEWIEGIRLSDRLATEGPLSEREARAVVRRLAEGVAEAHRVGLAVGGLTPEHVVLRPGGLVGLLSVPAASGTEKGDITALGALLELCLTGLPGARPAEISSPDLAALVRRARSTDPATGLSSVTTMVSLLVERPRTGPQEAARPDGLTDSGWVRRLRDRRDLADADEAAEDDGDEDQPVRLVRNHLPPVPGASLSRPLSAGPAGYGAEGDLVLDGTFVAEDDGVAEREASSSARRRLAVIGLPVLALALVVAIGWWFGTNVLSVAGSVEGGPTGSTPESSTTAAAAPAPGEEPAPAPPAAGAPVLLTGATVFDPFGDGEPENDDEVPLSFDGDPSTAWSTLNYRGSADFGNLKPGVGVLYDLGSAQPVSSVALQTTRPGATVEVRTGGSPEAGLEAFDVAASAELTGEDVLEFAEPATTRYVLVWVTGLVPVDEGFSADLAEVSVTAAG